MRTQSITRRPDRGHRAKQAQDRKSCMIAIRLSAKEHRLLAEAASRVGRPLSTYVREAANAAARPEALVGQGRAAPRKGLQQRRQLLSVRISTFDKLIFDAAAYLRKMKMTRWMRVVALAQAGILPADERQVDKFSQNALVSDPELASSINSHCETVSD